MASCNLRELYCQSGTELYAFASITNTEVGMTWFEGHIFLTICLFRVLHCNIVSKSVNMVTWDTYRSGLALREEQLTSGDLAPSTRDSRAAYC